MYKIIKLSLFYLFFIILSQPVLAENVMEPELFELNEAYLTSAPQEGITYHVMRTCADDEMSEDCTQSNYKANIDGSVQIPYYNRCLYRVGDFENYLLHYQIKAVNIEGLESDWTIPRQVTVLRKVRNLEKSSFVYSIVRYQTD